MGRIIEALRRKNRTLLELQAGILFLGVVCQIIGAFLVYSIGLSRNTPAVVCQIISAFHVKDQEEYARSLWIGVLLALAGSIHMHRALDRGLDMGAAAGKVIVASYLVRYGVLVLAAAAGTFLGLCNPLVMFLGYMTMKGAAYLQPFTHKLTNRIFHETDPIPEALPEEMQETPGISEPSEPSAP